MKHRHGFVSNSSSSSFIVAFRSQRPSGEEILAKFGLKGKEYIQYYDEIKMAHVFSVGAT